MNKYNPQKTAINNITCDSRFEARVLKTLQQSADGKNIFLATQAEILIKPKTCCFDARYWKCDFRLNHLHVGHLNIEAKGFSTRDFRLTLEMLECFNPLEFSRTIIITENKDVHRRYQTLTNRVWSVQELKSKMNSGECWQFAK